MDQGQCVRVLKGNNKLGKILGIKKIAVSSTFKLMRGKTEGS